MIHLYVLAGKKQLQIHLVDFPHIYPDIASSCILILRLPSMQ